MSGSNRRGFFRLAATEAVRGAREVIPLVDPLLSLTEPPAREAAAPPPQQDIPGTEPASPTTRSVSIDEMLEIARELGLDSRGEDLRRLAVHSARLVPVDDDRGSSFAGGEPEIPASVEAPDLKGGPARFVAALALPEGGRVWLLRKGVVDESAGDPTSADFAATLEVTEAGAASPIPLPPGARALSAFPELTLPRPWSRTVASLELSPPEQDAWQELRTRLAAAHGVGLGESEPSRLALHRVGGFPDERRGDMPLICELRLLGVDLEGSPPAAHPLAAVLEETPLDWRLLAQLSADDDLGWSWGTPRERLYVWGHLSESGSSAYDDVQVVVQ